MKFWKNILLWLLVLPMARAESGIGRFTVTLTNGGFTRVAYVQVPTNYAAARPVPVVFVLHGAGGGGEIYLDRCGWAAKADKEGFIAIAPDGLPARPSEKQNISTNPRLWNSGQLLAISPRAKVDDVAYVCALLDHVAARFNVDTNRIFVAGHSNGGDMTFRLGAELSDRLAAIAAVAAGYVTSTKPARPLPTLYMVGTRDHLVPLAGGKSVTPWMTRFTPPVAELLERWAKAEGLEATPREISKSENLRVVEYGATNAPVVFRAMYLEGQGHMWPGGSMRLFSRLLQPGSGSIRATDVIWDFFKGHPRK